MSISLPPDATDDQVLRFITEARALAQEHPERVTDELLDQAIEATRRLRLKTSAGGRRKAKAATPAAAPLSWNDLLGGEGAKP